MTATLFPTFVAETSQTGGTGPLALDGTDGRHVSFVSAVGAGNRVAYVIRGRLDTADAGKFEEGVGTITAGPDTLARTNVGRSSAGAGVAENFTAGVTVDVFVPSATETVLNSLLANHAGTTRPGWLPQYAFWLKTSTGELFLFDGTDDILTGTYNFTSNTFTPAGLDSLGALASLDTVGTTEIDNNAVTDAKLRDSAAVSVIGRAGGTAGDPADIVAGADGDVLRRAAGAVGFGSIPSSSVTGLGALAALNAVSQAQINSAAVGQAQVKTASGEVSTSSPSAANFTLPGGEYGFYPRVKNQAISGLSTTAQIANSKDSSSYITNIYLSETGGTDTVYAFQRYLQSSPPYDYGEGAVHGFVMLMLRADRSVLCSAVSPDPVWHNNGPTMRRLRRHWVAPGRLIAEPAPDATEVLVSAAPALVDTEIAGVTRRVWLGADGILYDRAGTRRQARHLLPAGVELPAALRGVAASRMWRAGARTLVRDPTLAPGSPMVMLAPDTDITEAEALADLVKMRAYVEALRAPEREQRIREMTMADKLADAPVLPHPFPAPGPGETVVIIDPMSQLALDVLTMTEHGDQLTGATLLHSGYVEIDNEDLRETRGRLGPPCVMAAARLR